MSDDLKQLIADAEKLLRKYARRKSRDLDQVRASLEDAVDEYKEMLADRAAAASDQVQEWTSSATRYARTNPWTTVAAGIGVVAVVLLLTTWAGGDKEES